MNISFPLYKFLYLSPVLNEVVLKLWYVVERCIRHCSYVAPIPGLITTLLNPVEGVFLHEVRSRANHEILSWSDSWKRSSFLLIAFSLNGSTGQRLVTVFRLFRLHRHASRVDYGPVLPFRGGAPPVSPLYLREQFVFVSPCPDFGSLQLLCCWSCLPPIHSQFVLEIQECASYSWSGP